MNRHVIIELTPGDLNFTEVEPAAHSLQRGGVVIYPTETVYGLGAMMFSESAVQRVYEIKGREPDKPLSVMIASREEIAELCSTLTEPAEMLMAAFWPGPLTLILSAGNRVPAYLKSSKNTIGIRFPDHAICNALVRLVGQPLTSTSANFSGEPTPASFFEISEPLQNRVDFILDGGACRERVPSTVVDVSTGKTPQLLRAGSIPFATILDCVRGKK